MSGWRRQLAIAYQKRLQGSLIGMRHLRLCNLSRNQVNLAHPHFTLDLLPARTMPTLVVCPCQLSSATMYHVVLPASDAVHLLIHHTPYTIPAPFVCPQVALLSSVTSHYQCGTKPALHIPYLTPAPVACPGAPPDMFGPEGQNWGFPTYNWEEVRGQK